MESPLNIAHRHRRKAEALALAGRYEEALEHHSAAEKALADIELCHNCESIMQSIKLQRQYHIRQQALIRHKQRKAEIMKTHNEIAEKTKVSEQDSVLPFSVENEFYRTNKLIHQAVQAMCEQNSLITGITDAIKQGTFSSLTAAPMSRSLDSRITKMSKNEETKLEELFTSNEELKKILFLLIGDMERIRSENKTLRNSLEELLFNHQKCLSSKTSNSLPNSSPSSLASHVPSTGSKNENSCELPELAPVKVHNFELKGK